MKANVARRVNHYRLSKVKGYYSIFEAVSNSFDSFEKITSNSFIQIEFYRDTTGFDFGLDIHERLFREVRITDNGVGFNDINYLSFNTSDSDLKESLGGKGLGRFSWLKVFEQVKIESYYYQDEEYYKRSFDFIKTPEGIDNDKVVSSSEKKTGTIIHLYNQRKEWLIPKKITTFCEKLIEHFLPRFLDATQPVIVIKDIDSGEEINVNNFFNINYNGLIGNKPVLINGIEFYLSVHKTKIGSTNQLIYLANNRASKIINLAKVIINLNADLFDGDEKYFIISFVSSKYLDDSVTPERDEFTFDDDPSDDDLSTQVINSSICAAISELIQPLLEAINVQKKKKIDEFISTEGPEYRYILNQDKTLIENISPIATKNEIEQQFHKAEVHYKEETAKKVKSILSKEDLNEEEIQDVTNPEGQTPCDVTNPEGQTPCDGIGKNCAITPRMLSKC
jgi:hypothetical protein